MTSYANSTLASDYQQILARLRNAKELCQKGGVLFAVFGLSGEDINNICAYTTDADATVLRALQLQYDDEASRIQKAIGHAADSIGSKLADLEM